MKLWQKISAICVIVLLAIVVLCSALLLVQSKNSILSLTVQHAKDKQRTLKNAFVSMADYYIAEDTGDAAKYSMVVYCFSRFADETGVLVHGQETIVSQAAVCPEKILSLPTENAALSDNEAQMYLGEIEGRNMLIVGSKAFIRTQLYDVYVVEDISAVYNEIAGMIGRFCLICISGIAVGTVMIIVLVRRVSKPLSRLGITARQIAGGNYTKRADVCGRDEVGLLAEDFNRMADAVETHVAELTETAQRQRLFIGDVTHEFKTPMTSILIHSDTLLNTKMSEEDAARSLMHIYDQCRWLERLTQKLLKLVVLKKDITLRDEPVAALFNAVYDSTGELMQERGTPLVVECAADTLPMDFDLMCSLLINLVDNASKASEEGQSIRLRADGNVIEVRDSGCGIEKQEIEKLTEPFYMVDRSRGKRKGGSGLGLALVRQIADAHNARLVIESVPGCGTCVQVVFP